MMSLPILILVSTLVTFSQQQNTCSSSPLPDLNGSCPDDTTLVTDGCCPNADLVVPTTTVAAVTTVATTVAATTTCVDLLNPSTGVSDCPKNAGLCTNTVYLSLMKVQCPKTCGYCTSSAVTTTTTTCVDLLNPSTGVSDCPKNVGLCTNTVYLSLMKTQCPKTCGYCTSSGTSVTATSTSTTCVDLLNPSTGVSDCPANVGLCTNSTYRTLMQQQCPKTCGYCTSG